MAGSYVRMAGSSGMPTWHVRVARVARVYRRMRMIPTTSQADDDHNDDDDYNDAQR